MGDHPYFWFQSDQGGRRKLGQRVSKGFKERTKLYKVVFDVWVRKTLIHPWVLFMVGLGWL